MLALLQEQWGWTSMTSRHSPAARGIRLATGHDGNAIAGRPGVASNRRTARTIAPIVTAHTIAAATSVVVTVPRRTRMFISSSVLPLP